MKNSIRRLFKVLSGLIVLPMFLVGVILVGTVYRAQRDRAIEHQEEIAFYIGQEIAGFIGLLNSELQVAAHIYNFNEMDADDIKVIFSKLESFQKAYAELALLNDKGQEMVRVSQQVTFTENDLRNRAQSDEYILTMREGTTYYGPVKFNEQTGEPYMIIAEPIIDVRSGLVQAIFVANIRLKSAWDLVTNLNLGESGLVYIVDSQGNVIAHRNSSLVLRGTKFEIPENGGIRQGLDGNIAVMGIYKIHLAGQEFFVIAEQSIAEAMYLTLETVVAMAVLIVTALVAIGIWGFITMRQLVQPIEAMSGAAQAVAAGDFDQHVPVFRDDEVGMLAESFNQMASTLGTMLASLEMQVEERTAELKKAQLAALSMMEDAEEARQKAEQINEDLKAAQVATMNIMKDVEDARNRAEQANVELVQEKAFSDNIINSIPGVFYVFDEEGKFLRWNDNLAKITGYSHDEIARMHPLQLFSGEAADYIASRIQMVFEDGYADVESEFTSKSGLKLPYYFTGYRTEINDQVILIGTAVDISERIQAEKALEQKAQELQRSNKELEQFAYVASHDLQEPLRMVASYLQLLERRYAEKLDEDAREFIDFAVDGATRMKRLINDLLSYSRVGTRGKPLSETDLAVVLEQVLSQLKPAIADAQAEIIIGEMPAVLSDETQMMQLFQNLIANAIKFRSKGKAPCICVGAERMDDEWRISVKDNGIGFDPQFAERIFVIFQRLHGKNEYSGTGIGLAISKRIVERHGGRIWAESNPGEGATFYFLDSSIKCNPVMVEKIP